MPGRSKISLRKSGMAEWLDATSECCAHLNSLAALVAAYGNDSPDGCVDARVVGGTGALLMREAHRLDEQIQTLRGILAEEGIY